MRVLDSYFRDYATQEEIARFQVIVGEATEAEVTADGGRWLPDIWDIEYPVPEGEVALQVFAEPADRLEFWASNTSALGPFTLISNGGSLAPVAAVGEWQRVWVKVKALRWYDPLLHEAIEHYYFDMSVSQFGGTSWGVP